MFCLLRPSFPFYAKRRNPYELKRQHLQMQRTTAGKLEKLALLDRIQHLRDYVDDRRQVQRALETIRHSGAENDLVKTEATACLEELRAFSLPSQHRTQHW